jgi:hypothetical protein
MSIWICGWMNYVDLNMWMLCMDVNVLFMNIVNIYICILYCQVLNFQLWSWLFRISINFFSDSRLIYDGWVT